MNKRGIERNAYRKRKSRILVKFFMLFIIYIILTICSLFSIKYGLLQCNFLNIKSLEIQNARITNSNKLYLELAKYIGKNIINISTSDIDEIVNDYPSIESYELLLRLPPKLQIKLTERKIIAYISSQNQEFLIDNVGYIVDYSDKSTKEKYPLFSGFNISNLELGKKINSISLNKLLHVYEIAYDANPNFVDNIYEFNINKNDITLRERSKGILFLLGKEDFFARINKLIFAYENFGFANFSEIDVRFSDFENELVILR